jgi:hypothetical protein
MESTLSTLAELAANLRKLERRAETTLLDTAAHDAMGWEELMPLGQTSECRTAIDIAPRSRVTVLRVIEGDLA